MRAQERRDSILGALAAREHVSTSDLGQTLGVSVVTIRSDLEVLEERGRLRRVHGGAVIARPLVETSHDARAGVDAVEKAAIARTAVGLLEPGMSIVLDVGTTTLAIADRIATDLAVTDLTVITNGLLIAMRLEAAAPRVEVHLTGGTLRPMQHSLVGTRVVEALSELRVNISFIGCDGIHASRGVTTTNFPEADIKEAMRVCSERSVLVAATGKLDEVAMVRINDISAFDSLIVDDGLDEVKADELDALGIEVVTAESAL